MHRDRAGELLQDIHRVLASDHKHLPYHALLIAQLDDNWVSPAIFKDRGKHVLYREPMPALTEPLLALWALGADSKRWAELEFYIYVHRFCVAFVYPHEIDPNEEDFDRRDRTVKRYFGDKPIVYPSASRFRSQTFVL